MSEAKMSDTDRIIDKLFSTRWSDDLRNSPIEDKRAQLHKNLQNQIDGYWSGHTAYYIMVDGGFIVDSKRVYVNGKCKGKKLTLLGEMFMDSMKKARGEHDNN